MKQTETLRDLVINGSRSYGDLPALRTIRGSEYSYTEVLSAADSSGVLLRDAGVRPGDRVVLLSENRSEWGIWYFAITGLGAVVVPVLTDFQPHEVERIIEHSDPAAIVVSDSMRRLIPGDSDRVIISVAAVAQEATQSELDDADVPEGGAEINADTTAAIIYTSGTTGEPKGVVLTHGNLVSNAHAAKALVTIGPGDRLLSILPLAHTYECTIGFLVPYVAGACVTYLNGPPALSKLLPALADVRPTMMLSVPLIMEKLYRSKVKPIFRKLGFLGTLGPVRKLVHRVAARKVKSTFGGELHFFGIGGAALSPETERFLREGKFPYAIGYGLTETAPLLAGTNAENTRFRATGPAIEGVELRLVPLTNEEQETRGAPEGKPPRRRRRRSRNVGQIGEVQARGPNVMVGYYRNPDATEKAFTDDGWFKTGDIGSLDDDGYLTIRGRLKTMLVGPSGENVYPEEIEAAINAEALVEESLVLSGADGLVARVRLNVDALAERIGEMSSNLDSETIQTRGAQALADIKKEVNARLNRFSRIARMVLQLEEFERTPTRKIKRFLYEQS